MTTNDTGEPIQLDTSPNTTRHLFPDPERRPHPSSTPRPKRFPNSGPPANVVVRHLVAPEPPARPPAHRLPTAAVISTLTAPRNGERLAAQPVKSPNRSSTPIRKSDTRHSEHRDYRDIAAIDRRPPAGTATKPPVRVRVPSRTPSLPMTGRRPATATTPSVRRAVEREFAVASSLRRGLPQTR